MVFLGVFTSQFYIFSSGLPQPSHFLLFFAFLFILFNRSFYNSGWIKKDCFSVSFFIFVFSSLFLNFLYFLYLDNESFLISNVHLIYGFFIFFLFLFLFNMEGGDERIVYFLCLSLASLFLLSVFNLGRFNFFPRYNAFFNDPNQMAYWVLCIFSIIACSRNLSNLMKLVFFVFSCFIIFKSFSRSGLIGVFVIAFGVIISQFFDKDNKIKSKSVLVGLFLIFISSLSFISFISYNKDDYSYFASRTQDADVLEQMDVRGYTRISNYPEYLFFGSGQGGHDRFLNRYNAPSTHEIHSTWAGLLFYYGLWGLTLWLIMHLFVLKRLPIYYKLIFLGPAFYAFSTYGLRTPVFWIYLSYFYYLSMNINKKVSS